MGPNLTSSGQRMAQTAEAVRGGPVAPHRMLAIGDAVRTDIAGAAAFGIDSLFIGQGIHRDEVLRDGRIESADLMRLLEGQRRMPVAAMTGVAW